MDDDTLMDVIRHAEQVGADNVRSTLIHRTEDEERILVRKGNDAEPEILVLKRQRPDRRHSFDDLEGFVEYLNSSHTADDAGIVFVSDNQVSADLAYKQHSIQTALLGLTLSPEYQALSNLKEVSQKELFTILISDLSGCFPDELLLQIRSIRVNKDNEGTVKIDPLGVVSGKQGLVTKITATGAGDVQEAEIGTEWTFEVPVWTCMDEVYEVKTRLEVDVVNGALFFTFHRIRIDKVLRSAKKNLVAELSETVERFDVYEGVDRTAYQENSYG